MALRPIFVIMPAARIVFLMMEFAFLGDGARCTGSASGPMMPRRGVGSPVAICDVCG